MKGPTLALLALAAATAALAQSTPPPTTAEPRTSTAPQEQTPRTSTPPSEPGATPNRADTQALMNDCMTQVQAANPKVPEKDIRNFCENEIGKSTQPR